MTLYDTTRNRIRAHVRRTPHMAFLLDVYDRKLHAYIDAPKHNIITHAGGSTRKRRASANTITCARRRSHETPPSVLRIGTDCSGIEAPVMALRVLGVPHRHVFSTEIDPHARVSIRANYQPEHEYTDVFARDHRALPDVDVYVCGFPCQSFSDINSSGAKGFAQENRKGKIFFHCYEVIRQKRPRVFVLENVRTLLTHDDGRTFGVIQAHLNRLAADYLIGHKVLNAKDYDGHLQNRPRVYIVGIRRDYLRPTVVTAEDFFPSPSARKVPLDNVWLHDDDPRLHDVAKTHLTPHKQSLLERFVARGHDVHNVNHVVNLNISGGVKFPGHPMKDKSPCLLAYCSPFYLTGKRRSMHAREALRLQGFPDTFQQVVSDKQMLQQCGNSMSVGVLAHLLRGVLLCLR